LKPILSARLKITQSRTPRPFIHRFVRLGVVQIKQLEPGDIRASVSEVRKVQLVHSLERNLTRKKFDKKAIFTEKEKEFDQKLFLEK